MAKEIGKNEDADRAKELLAGTLKHFPGATSLSFGKGSVTAAQVEQSLQSIVDLRTAVTDAQANVKAKLAAEAAQRLQLREFLLGYIAFVKANFAGSPEVLADFGLAPKKKRTHPKADDVAAAVAKRKSTRAARHTMGPKQTLT